MPRFAAFLRGVNLGRRRVKMDDLRAHVSELEVDDVVTFLASGNVAFDHVGSDLPDLPVLEERFEDHLESALGFGTDTFVRPIDRLAEILELEEVEAAEAEGFTPYVTFLKEEAGEAVEEALGSLETPDDEFHVLGREVLWFRRGRLSDSTIGTRDLERALGGATSTRRKLATVRRIVEKSRG